MHYTITWMRFRRPPWILHNSAQRLNVSPSDGQRSQVHHMDNAWTQETEPRILWKYQKHGALGDFPDFPHLIFSGIIEMTYVPLTSPKSVMLCVCVHVIWGAIIWTLKNGWKWWKIMKNPAIHRDRHLQVSVEQYSAKGLTRLEACRGLKEILWGTHLIGICQKSPHSNISPWRTHLNI